MTKRHSRSGTCPNRLLLGVRNPSAKAKNGRFGGLSSASRQSVQCSGAPFFSGYSNIGPKFGMMNAEIRLVVPDGLLHLVQLTDAR